MITKALNALFDKIANFFYDLTYRIGTFILRILKLLYQMFGAFSGSETVYYQSKDQYLINVFFNSKIINVLYAGMACIGIVILLVMTIITVAKKSVDVDDKMQAPMGTIIRKLLSSFLLIVSMNFIMLIAINFSNVLMQSIEYLFDNAGAIAVNKYHEFTDKEYAAMARIYNTIGNYSLNDSYQSRFNLNSCYNEIRADLYYLDNQGVFEYSYPDSVGGVSVQSWQSVLSKIAKAHDVSEDMPLDEYDSTLSLALLNAMEFSKKNNNEMTVLQYYYIQNASATATDATLDVCLFLAATTNAAHNAQYNGSSVSFGDSIRSAYLSGEKSIYDINTVKNDFSLAFSDFDHLVVIVGGIIFVKEFFALCINCVARIFNMLLLYILAPPFIATAPLDDGAKFKQWKTAFVIQCFNVFGTVISLRLLVLIIPIIFDSSLRIIGSGFTEMLAKVVLTLGAVYTARRANGLVTGILSENAGYQSIMAGDAASAMKQSTVGKAYEAVKGAAGDLGGAAVKGALNLGGSAVKGAWNLIKSPFSGGSKKSGGGGEQKTAKAPENKGAEKKENKAPENKGSKENKGPENKGSKGNKGPEKKENKAPENKGNKENKGSKYSQAQKENVFGKGSKGAENKGSKGPENKGSKDAGQNEGSMIEMQDLSQKSETQPENLSSQGSENKNESPDSKADTKTDSRAEGNPGTNAEKPLQNLSNQGSEKKNESPDSKADTKTDSKAEGNPGTNAEKPPQNLNSQGSENKDKSPDSKTDSVSDPKTDTKTENKEQNSEDKKRINSVGKPEENGKYSQNQQNKIFGSGTKAVKKPPVVSSKPQNVNLNNLGKKDK